MARRRIILPVCFALVGCSDFVGVGAPDDIDDAATSGKADDPDDPTGLDPDDDGESSGGNASGDGDSSGGGRDPIPDTCGDGVLDVGEACDDGEATATCDADCTPAECGDGTKNAAAGEVCDDGGASASCDDDCTVATCGDGNLNEAAGEECDDGSGSAECDADCTAAQCGDGTVNTLAGEVCDGSASCAADCLSCTADVPTALIDEGFGGAAAGWTMQGAWAIGPAVSSADMPSCGYGDPGQDHTPGGDNNPALRVRFGFRIDAIGAFECAGWNVDDVRIDTLTCG